MDPILRAWLAKQHKMIQGFLWFIWSHIHLCLIVLKFGLCRQGQIWGFEVRL
jgi:hypothetical protein